MTITPTTAATLYRACETHIKALNQQLKASPKHRYRHHIERERVETGEAMDELAKAFPELRDRA